MGRARQKLFGLVALVIVAVVSGCESSKPSDPLAMNVSSSTEKPELAMEKTKIQSFGPNGIEWELETPTAQGYTLQNKMHAQNLLITFYRGGRKATDLTADQGVIRFDDSKVSASTIPIEFQEGPVGLGPGDLFLTGNVVAVSTDGSKLYTDWLRYDKSEGLITSTAPVRVVREDSITNGVGLRAMADLSNVKIFNQTVTIKEQVLSEKKKEKKK